MKRDVVHPDVADPALERACVRVTVDDEVGPVLGDRAGDPVVPEHDVDPLGLSDERLLCRRVVESGRFRVASTAQ